MLFFVACFEDGTESGIEVFTSSCDVFRAHIGVENPFCESENQSSPLDIHHLASCSFAGFDPFKHSEYSGPPFDLGLVNDR